MKTSNKLETIEKNIILAAQSFILEHGENIPLPEYFYLNLQMFFIKIFEAAEDIENADELIKEAFKNARHEFLEIKDED